MNSDCGIFSMLIRAQLKSPLTSGTVKTITWHNRLPWTFARYIVCNIYGCADPFLYVFVCLFELI